MVIELTDDLQKYAHTYCSSLLGSRPVRCEYPRSCEVFEPSNGFDRVLSTAVAMSDPFDNQQTAPKMAQTTERSDVPHDIPQPIHPPHKIPRQSAQTTHRQITTVRWSRSGSFLQLLTILNRNLENLLRLHAWRRAKTLLRPRR
jgi:hypothetical protein